MEGRNNSKNHSGSHEDRYSLSLSQGHHLATLTMLLSYSLSAHISEARGKDKVIAMSVTASIPLLIPTEELLIKPGDETAHPILFTRITKETWWPY